MSSWPTTRSRVSRGSSAHPEDCLTLIYLDITQVLRRPASRPPGAPLPADLDAYSLASGPVATHVVAGRHRVNHDRQPVLIVDEHAVGVRGNGREADLIRLLATRVR